MLKRGFTFILMLILIITATGCVKKDKVAIDVTTITVEEEKKTNKPESIKVKIEDPNMQSGTVTIKYLGEYQNDVIITIVKDKMWNGYIINDFSEPTVLGLNYGNGSYVVSVDEKCNLGGTILLAEKEFVVEGLDEFTPFLQSTYAVKYSENMEAIEYANEMNETATSNVQRICNIHNFVLESLYYYEDPNVDYSNWKYYSDIQNVYMTGRGVCTDYATLFTAMCRDQGIPCRIVAGETGADEAWHVWTEVYIDDEGIYDYEGYTLYGNSWNLIDLTLDDAIRDNDAEIVYPDYYDTRRVD